MDNVLKLKDGTEVPIRLTFKDLYNLEKSNSELSEMYFETMKKEELNEIDMVKVIYVAYMCAGNNVISFEEFLDKISNNRNEVLVKYYELIYPKN